MPSAFQRDHDDVREDVYVFLKDRMSNGFASNAEQALTLEQRRSVGYVMNGTFLEYFDLMTVAHLTPVLVSVFAPPVSSEVRRLLESFGLVLSLIVRPFGALFWGYIGDRVGRVVVLFWTTLLMGFSCIMVPLIPSFSEAGYYALVLFLAARLIQGFSSSGEMKAAEIFLTELFRKNNKASSMTTLMAASVHMANCASLLMVALTTSSWFGPDGWKVCFYLGAGIAGFAALFRRRLRESKEFTEAVKTCHYGSVALKQYFAKRNFFCLMALNMPAAIGFVLAYDTSRHFLSALGMTSSEIALHNVKIGFFTVFYLVFLAFLVSKFDPFSVFKKTWWVGLGAAVLGFIILHLPYSFWTISIAQLLLFIPFLEVKPAVPRFIRGFHPHARFKGFGMAWACSKPIMYVMAAALSSCSTQAFGFYGLFVLLFASIVASFFAMRWFVPEEEMQQKFLASLKDKLA